MKIARFSVDGYEFHGSVEGDRVRAIQGSVYGEHRVTGLTFPLAGVKLLPPTRPVNFWNIGLNYQRHLDARVEEGYGEELRERVQKFNPFFKGSGASIVAHGEAVRVPPGLPDFIDYEGELCIVIGKPAHRVSAADAPAYILGYTIANDIGAGPAWFKSDFTGWRTKASDTFAPVGPWIATDLDPHDLDIIVRVDGREEQRGSTRDMLRNCYEIVSGISRYCTLHPGDLISTGSPSPTRPLRPGEVVEVEIPPIGVLRNPIAAA
jgi:2-keto-4-pentenoate hydratase/2-oxohepta-3-ene-1,7-dioic acid hydratase in catechol pathway